MEKTLAVVRVMPSVSPAVSRQVRSSVGAGSGLQNYCRRGGEGAQTPCPPQKVQGLVVAQPCTLGRGVGITWEGGWSLDPRGGTES